MTGIGSKISYLGQEYEVVGFRDHTRRDGTPSLLTRYRSRCAKCGAFFETNAPTFANRLALSRRCKKHKWPLKRV